MSVRVTELKAEAAADAVARHGGALPAGYSFGWRRYGTGGRWRGVGPNGWVEGSNRALIERETWWMVAADDNDREQSATVVSDPVRAAPHTFVRQGWRWWICRHCYAPRRLHPRRGWVKARPLDRHEFISADAPHFKEGW